MSDRGTLLALLAQMLVVAMGSSLDVMEVDAAQYAAMSQDLLASDNWLKLFHRGQDYLDKPPLLFWASALSFKAFGMHNWSYKLPSILFAFLAMFSTYRFALMHYGRSIARYAMLMLGSCAAFLLMTNDVRCDTMLMGAVITAIWLGSAYMIERKWWQLIGFSVFVAVGMLAKGPMGAMAPVLALGGDVVFRRKWAVLRDARLLMVPVLIVALLVPMCIGLYEQHGMHGLRFYFWEQSFGRLTGENRWKDDSTALFFTHEVLWELLPWTAFVVIGLWRSLVAVIKRLPLVEYVTTSGIVLVFIALSLSHFKLPHYLYVIVPLFAVQAARVVEELFNATIRTVQLVLVGILTVMALVLLLWAFPEGALPFVLLCIVGVGLAAFMYFRAPTRMSLFALGYWAMMLVGVVLNGHLYPSILRYQANAQVGKVMKGSGIPSERFVSVDVGGTALNFYTGYTVNYRSSADEALALIKPGTFVYTNAVQLERLEALGTKAVESTRFPNYSVQLLGFDFLSPATRESVLEERYLLRY